MSGAPRPGPALYLRATLFWILHAASVILLGPLIMTFALLPVRTRFRLAPVWAHFNVWWLGLTCGLRHRVQGLENVPDRPVIIMVKHQSTWETISMATILPPHVYVLKRELLKIPFFGWGVAAMRPIAIDRSAGRKAVEQMLEQGRDRLRHGLSVLVFPEGTRTRPGTRTRYKMGGAILAAETGVPVLPVAHNAGDYWPRHSYVKRPGVIEVRIGPLIETAGRTPEQINQAVQDWIEGQMAAISDPGSRPVPGVATG